MFRISLFLILVTMMSSANSKAETIDLFDGLPDMIRNPEKWQTQSSATVDEVGSIHVLIVEQIDSTTQADWKQGYDAVITVVKDGKTVGSFRGSTLPNNVKPKNNKHKYSVLLSTCNFNRYYTWTKGLRADKKRPCLRLKKTVPTINVSSARDIVPKYLSEHGHFEFAENILVHSGYKNTWRGSAGCITIHPDDSAAFFELIPSGKSGTLEVIRKLGPGPTLTCY